MSKKYPSRYSNGKEISAAQYITEFICEKMADKNKKELTQKFWDLPEWKKDYKSQLFAAYGLLKIRLRSSKELTLSRSLERLK